MGIDPADGRPWILVPGTLCTGAVFEGLLAGLGVAASACTTIDLTEPRVEDYTDALTAAVTPDAIVCGFSLGAMVTAHLADRVEASQIVLFGLNPHADDPAKRGGRLALAQDVAKLGGAAALDGRLQPLAGPNPQQGRAQVLAMADAAAPMINAQTSLALNRPGALAALAQARCPVTLLTGTDDTQAPFDLALEAADIVPQGRAVALDGLGHYALVEDPAACARALSDVWKAP